MGSLSYWPEPSMGFGGSGGPGADVPDPWDPGGPGGMGLPSLLSNMRRERLGATIVEAMGLPVFTVLLPRPRPRPRPRPHADPVDCLISCLASCGIMLVKIQIKPLR